jgi:hypothetical protein
VARWAWYVTARKCCQFATCQAQIGTQAVDRVEEIVERAVVENDAVGVEVLQFAFVRLALSAP